MTRPFINLRRALLGTSCAIVFGLGGAELLARPAAAVPPPFCNDGYILCRTCTGAWYCAPYASCPPCEVGK